MPLVVHVHHVRRHVIEVVVDGSDLEPPAEEAGHHGLHFLIEQDEIAHDHRLVSHLLERRVRSEGEPSLHRDTPNGDGEIGPGHPDPEDLAGLNLARLAELPLHCLPVGVCGACHCRRAHNRDKTENNYRRVQYPKSHGQDLPLHLGGDGVEALHRTTVVALAVADDQLLRETFKLSGGAREVA